MISEEERNRLIDYFESWELALWLKLPIEDLVDYFEDEIEDKMEALNDFMDFTDKDKEDE